MSENKNLPPTPELQAINLDPESMAATNLGEMIEHQFAMANQVMPDSLEDGDAGTTMYLVGREGDVSIVTKHATETGYSITTNTKEDGEPLGGYAKRDSGAVLHIEGNRFTASFTQGEGSGVEGLNKMAHVVADSVPVDKVLWRRAAAMYGGDVTTTRENESVLKQLNKVNRAMNANDEDAEQTAFSKPALQLVEPARDGTLQAAGYKAEKRSRKLDAKRFAAHLALVGTLLGVGYGLYQDRDEITPRQPVAEAPAVPGQAAEEARVVADIRQNALDSARVIIGELGAPGTATQITERSITSNVNVSYELSNDTDIAPPKGPVVSAEIDVDQKWLTVTSQSASEATDPRAVTIGFLLPEDSLTLQKAKAGTVTTKDMLHALDGLNSTDILAGSIAYDEAENGHNSVQYVNDGLADVYDASQPRGRLSNLVASANTIGDNLPSVVNALDKEFKNAQR